MSIEQVVKRALPHYRETERCGGTPGKPGFRSYSYGDRSGPESTGGGGTFRCTGCSACEPATPPPVDELVEASERFLDWYDAHFPGGEGTPASGLTLYEIAERARAALRPFTESKTAPDQEAIND